MSLVLLATVFLWCSHIVVASTWEISEALRTIELGSNIAVSETKYTLVNTGSGDQDEFEIEASVAFARVGHTSATQGKKNAARVRRTGKGEGTR